MSAFIHAQAICESEHIGERTRIWAFAHILPGARIGTDCNICDHTFIENDVILGNRVTIKCGVQLWDSVQIEDDVFVGPNATFTNDKTPRSGDHSRPYLKTLVQKGASIGANATILPGLVIGQGSMIGAGAVVTRSVPPHAIVVGNPAKITGYVNSPKFGNHGTETPFDKLHAPKVKGISLHSIPNFTDLRGSLSVAEFDKEIPFSPKRFFTVFDVPTREVRGEHAHKECHQFLICLNGTCTVLTDDGHHREEFALEPKGFGLYLPPMVWGTQYKYSEDAILLVFASHLYDPNDYIRDYSEFLKLKGLT